MLIVNLKSLMIQEGAKRGKRLTYADISEATGIRVSTLSRIANDQVYNISRAHIEALCLFFDCTLSDLLTIIPDKKGQEEGN